MKATVGLRSERSKWNQVIELAGHSRDEYGNMVSNLHETPYRFRLRSLFWLTAISAVILFFGYRLFHYLVFGTGPANYRWLWPTEIKALLDNMPGDEAKEIQQIRVECVKKILDKEYLARFQISNPAYEVMKARNKLTLVPRERVDSRFFRQPVAWWDPDPEKDVEFTASDELPHLLLMYDKQKNSAYLMYLDQF
jgi:hypothetical protein